MAGSWAFTADCTPFVTVDRTLRLADRGNRASGPIRHNLGQRGTATVWVEGRSIRGRNDWSHSVETWTATISEDWNGDRGRSQAAACAFRAWRR